MSYLNTYSVVTSSPLCSKLSAQRSCSPDQMISLRAEMTTADRYETTERHNDNQSLTQAPLWQSNFSQEFFCFSVHHSKKEIFKGENKRNKELFPNRSRQSRKVYWKLVSIVVCGRCKTAFGSVLQKTYKGMERLESEGRKSGERKVSTTEIL